MSPENESAVAEAETKAAPKSAAKPKPVEKVVEPPKFDDEPVVITQVPSIGRIVFYTTAQGTERPAIITRVVDDEEVDLTVFNSDGAVPVKNALLDEPGEPGSWSWPQR